MAQSDWWYDNDGPSRIEQQSYKRVTNLAEYMGMSREDAQKYFDHLDEILHTYDQGVEAIIAGYNSNVPFESIQKYVEDGINRTQMYGVSKGIKYGLSESQMDILANKNFDYDLINIIAQGFGHKYAKCDISENDMQEAILEYTDGKNASDKFSTVVQYLARGFSLDDFDRLDKKYSDIIYPSELKSIIQASHEGLTDEQIDFCIAQRQAEEQKYNDKFIDGNALRCWCIALEAGYTETEAKQVRDLIESIEEFTGVQYSEYWLHMESKYDLNFWSIAGPEGISSNVDYIPNINIDYLQIPVYMSVDVNDKQVQWYVFEPKGADKEPFAIQQYNSFEDMKEDFDKNGSCSVISKEFSHDEILKAKSFYKDALEHSNEKGRLVVICGPSGVGKTTTVKELQGKIPFETPASYTTREPRKGEIDGIDYHFVDRERFQAIQLMNGFLESAEFNGNLYGTSKDDVQWALNAGHNVLLDLELQGAKAVKEIFPDSVTVIMDVHNDEEREERLKNRSSDSEEVIQQRMEQGEIDRKEYKNIPGKKEHIFVYKDDTREAAFELADIIQNGHRTYEFGEYDGSWKQTMYDIDMQFSEDWKEPVKEKINEKKTPEKVSSGIPFDDR